jgi:RNA polymerase sigma factor (TIGR02999 family)
MTDVTRVLSQIEQGDPSVAEHLLPLVYDELRNLAAAKLAQENPGQTLQATALVHEAYIRLVDVKTAQHWNSRRHFFAAAAEAMRRILVEQARHRRRQKRGGGLGRVNLEEAALIGSATPEEVLAVNDALEKLQAEDPSAADLVSLHYFSGFSIDEVAERLAISRATAYRQWAYAKAWLRWELGGRETASNS